MSAVLDFVTPPPGLAPFTDFSLDDIDGVVGLYSLRSLDDTSIRLFVLDASVHLPNYTPEIPDQQCELLEILAPEDALVLVVANPSVSGTSMNLMAPIIVNASTGASAQVILEGQDWPLRAQLSN
jgi:flagellar assembly factor FliW